MLKTFDMPMAIDKYFIFLQATADLVKAYFIPFCQPRVIYVEHHFS